MHHTPTEECVHTHHFVTKHDGTHMVHTNYNNNTSKVNALAMQLLKQRSHMDEKITHYMISYKEQTHREQCQNCKVDQLGPSWEAPR